MSLEDQYHLRKLTLPQYADKKRPDIGEELAKLTVAVDDDDCYTSLTTKMIFTLRDSSLQMFYFTGWLFFGQQAPNDKALSSFVFLC